VSTEQGGMQLSPFRRFNTMFEFVLVSAPTYTVPSKVNQGSLIIGTVDGLKYPQKSFGLNVNRNYRTDLTTNGTPYSIDGATTADSYEASCTVNAHPTNAGRLIQYLTSARGADISVPAATGYYMFGAEKGSGDTYICKQLTNPLTITHDSCKSMSIPLRFVLKA
jgi:hypothetical protein